ncbi:unnamed protein product [Heligmosomoides polygyrus]|uniref:t-SNARE coiled-coil homology domain-containing protein n=1 Tax=Heligmosomoides polygyrus TaxID=6339 RepID=A0A3P7XQ83_HELPZ|nr:unnamed protein product [Heligmosomoides polygyrus]
MAATSSTRYSRLKDNDDEEPSGSAFEEILMKQEQIIREQDEDLVLVGNSVSTLKQMSYKIDKRQCKLIMILSVVIFFLILLLIVL